VDEEGEDFEPEGEGEDDEQSEQDEDEEGEEGEEDDRPLGAGDNGGPGAAGRAQVKGPINMKKLSSFKDKLEKTGVVYLSRVPPYMKAQKIRHLLSRYGEVGRIYLTPEDPAIRKKRKATGGNKKQSFVDGWIEFADKKVAKSVAKALNCQPIGGKATSFYSSDLWNLK
jgi:ESF2/ABP1 family protein